ncbi:MAG: pilus assembly protein TadG-related protein [Caulobacterales bacterium]|nr:pilus assembly protein TadG-related protein [Caulobacterales bacterium]
MPPLLFVVGAAIDLSQAVSARNHTLAALDAAGLAAARSGSEDEAVLYDKVDDFLKANLTEAQYEDLGNLSVDLVNERLELDADLVIDTVLLSALGIDIIDMPVSSVIAAGTGKIELALVLDNTGSMASGGKIGALRDAATALVNDLFEDPNADENIKVAIVPYNGMVNIRGDGFKWSWVDVDGDASHNGENFTPKTSHLDLFSEMGVDWKGCVELRAAPYDLTDDAPGGAADTKWTPYLWPDEPGGGSGNTFFNDYILDDEDYCDDCAGLSGEALQIAQQANTAKYAQGVDILDTTPSTTTGPNKGCGQAVTPLTNSSATLLGEITNMTTWGGSGTNGLAGLMWGWRTVSPGEPYDQGVGYGEGGVTKAIVLMTDGVNQFNDGDNPNGSSYSGYGYITADRLGISDVDQVAGAIGDRMAAACGDIKQAGVKIFAITFQLDDEATKSTYRDCASEPKYYYDAGTNEALVEYFTEIAGAVSQLRIAG